ncbi:MAG: PAS domain-containing sensor histidine kinase [Desulfomonile sp.]|nr:PAS domain-containing sensor histidine kinase [Desulfomonile sp.]
MNSDETELRRINEELERRVSDQTAELIAAKRQLHAEIERCSDIEKALEESEGRFRTLVEAAGDVIWSADLNMKLTYVSPSVTKLLGYTAEEMLAMDPLVTISPEFRERIMQTFRNELIPGEQAAQPGCASKTLEVEHRHKDGSSVWVEMTTTFLRDSNGRPRGILGISRDISQRKRVDDLKSDFVTTVAHELRTPLTSIRGYSELLLIATDLTPDERRECLTHINRQSIVMANIVSDMLDIARMESGKDLHMHLTRCDMGEQIRLLVDNYRAQSAVHQFKTDLPEGPVVLVTDEHRMRDVFDNLLSNAVKYSPNGGTIRVTCRVLGKECLFTVEDQGIGMSPQQVQRVFDKFYRADHSKTAIPGMGVGMTIVKYIIEAQGGRVWVESSVGKGTTVSFTLSMADAASHQGGETVEENTRRG